ncbi:hypothetical protein FRB90_008085 [Tulasnella sp. 427]|nr:hypothetical protein FRB90_008085 [Tulasnella sp. 427]
MNRNKLQPQCVAAPGNIASAVQLEAFKKLTLVQLIAYGKTRPLPKYVNFTTARVLKQQPYQTFAKNYPGTAAALNEVLEKDLAHFTADGNVGLMKQAIRHAPRWIIRRLTDTYVTLSVAEISKAIASDVASSSSPEAIEGTTLLILSMIEQNEIHATLTPSAEGPAAAIVTFRDPPPPKYFDPAVLEKIVREAQSSNTQLGLLDRDIGKSRTYLSKAVKDKDGPGMPFDDMADMDMERGIVIYSMYGHVTQLAEAEKAGIEKAGGSATIYQVAETLPEEVLQKMNAPAKPDYPIVQPMDLVKHDGILFGTFIDALGQLWMKGALVGKFVGAFVSTGGPGGGQEATFYSMLSSFTHHGMIFVPLGYPGVNHLISNIEEVHGGSPWGAGTFAGKGNRQPTKLELEVAEIQGQKFWQIVARTQFPVEASE